MTEYVEYEEIPIIFLGLVLHSITFWGILWYFDAIDYAFKLVNP